MQFLYGTEFADASEYCWPKQGRKPLQEFAESRFGTDDAKTKFLQDLRPLVERVVSFRNAVEQPGGRSGTLQIRNFRLKPNGKISELGWCIEKDGKSSPETSIRGDLCSIIEGLMVLGEEIV